MEVHLMTRQETTATAEAPHVAIQEYDTLLAAKAVARKQGKLELESECTQAMGQRYTAFLHTADAIDGNRVNDFVSPQTIYDDCERLHIAAVNILDLI